MSPSQQASQPQFSAASKLKVGQTIGSTTVLGIYTPGKGWNRKPELPR